MRRTLAALLVATFLLPTALAHAQSGDEGVRRFRAGVGLFKDGNFTGALAEFEEARRLHPTASVLSNIALCQKALFRYAEAIDTLQNMLAQYGSTLSADDTKVANAAIADLRGFVTQLTVAVQPADAKVSVDGRDVPGGAERKIAVNVGERRLVAEANGYRKSDQVVSVAGAEKRVEIALAADSGEITVTTDDPDAAIYVDGKEGSYGTWTGTVSAGVSHTITVFKPGFNPTTYQVTVPTGEARQVKAAVGERYRGPSAPPTPFPYVRPVTTERRHGPYVLIGASSLQVATQPDNFTAQGGNKPSGTYFGARAGWLLVPNLGIEAVFEGGTHSANGCWNAQQGNCTAPNSNYDLSGLRFGVAGRYITGGETFRFLADLGFGAAYHKLTLATPKLDPTNVNGQGSALGGMVMGDLGLEVSITRVLIDAVIAFSGDGVSAINVGGAKVYTGTSGSIGFGGVGVRVGYAFW